MKVPKKYTVTVTIAPQDDAGSDFGGVEFKATFEDVAREAILHPDYGRGGIPNMVKLFEHQFLGMVQVKGEER